MHDVTAGLRGELLRQQAFTRGRSPNYTELLAALIDALDDDLQARLALAWSHRTFHAWYERPLLLLASLRDDALRTGPDHPLWSDLADPSAHPRPRTDRTHALRSGLQPGRPFWDTVARRTLQTNETSRAVAWLWPAALIRQVDPTASLALFDVGASAGLNLAADRLPPIWTRADGAKLSTHPLPPIVDRTGFDLEPLDARDPDDARWLRATIWPDQRERLQRLEQAIDAWLRLDASEARVLRASADAVPALLPTVTPHGPRALAYQTIVRDYLPPAERDAYQHGMRQWLRRNPPGRALWVELEIDPHAGEGPPATLTTHIADDDQIHTRILARCEPHPRALTVDDAAVDTLKHLLRGPAPATA